MIKKGLKTFLLELKFMPLITVHFHTKDGEKLNIGKSCEAIAKDLEESKIDFLVLTDKAFAGEKIDLPIKAYEKVKSKLKTKDVFFGLEFDLKNFHILGLFLNPEKWKNKICPVKLEKVCKAIEKDEGIIGIPHQFGISGLGEKVDGILELYEKGEISSKPLIEISHYLQLLFHPKEKLSNANRKALEYAITNDLPIFSGLDARFKSFELAYNFSYKEPEKAFKKLEKFGSGEIIPYLATFSFPICRETFYLIRDHGVGFLRGGKVDILKFLMEELYSFKNKFKL